MKTFITLLQLIVISLAIRKSTVLRSVQPKAVSSKVTTKESGECTVRFILDAGSSGTGGALGLEFNNIMNNLDIKILRPEDLMNHSPVETFYSAQITEVLTGKDEGYKTEVIRILDNNLKLSNVNENIDTANMWSDAAKIHVKTFFNQSIKDKIDTFVATNNTIDCTNKDTMQKMSNIKTFMGATAGIRNVVNSYILKNQIDGYMASIRTMNANLGSPNFFKEFGFKYIAGRTEGMFGLVVALNKDAYKSNPDKYIYVEMGGASTQVAFKSDKDRQDNPKYVFKKAAATKTGGSVKAGNQQYFSQSFLGNACDRGPSSLIFNYVRDIIKSIPVDDAIKTITGADNKWTLDNKILKVNLDCINPNTKLTYQNNPKVFKDANNTHRIFFKNNIPGQIPTGEQIDDNYNKFMHNKTLQGLYADDYFDKFDSIEISGTPETDANKYTDCKKLVDKYLLGDGDDEYIDHKELEEIKEKLKKKDYSVKKLFELDNFTDVMKGVKTVLKGISLNLQKAGLQLHQSQASQQKQLSNNIDGLKFDKIILMTNAWTSFLGGRKNTVSNICPTIKTTDMTLKDFEDCLPKLCNDKAILLEGKNQNYGLCTIAINVHGILKKIATAVQPTKVNEMVIDRVISEWSEGPFNVKSSVFDKMQEDLFEGRGSKQFENMNKDYDE